MAKKPDSGAPGRRPGRGVRPDESELFRAAVGAAKPLRRPGKPADDAPPLPPPPSATPLQSAPRPRAKAGDSSVPGATPSAPPPASPALPELRPGAAAGVDARSMERLRRGQLRPEGRLDLHGMTQDEAHAALSDFLDFSRGAGRRCVIVITGKGRLRDGGGVLRNQVPRWLNQAGCRPHILGFSEAQPKDGGGGALYVLLRRRR